MTRELRDEKLKKARDYVDNPDTLRMAIEGLQEIEDLAYHPNSDGRIRDVVDNLLWDIAENLP